MQTDLRNRDLIGDLDFTQRRSRNRPGCGLGPEAQARPGRTACLPARQSAGDAVLLQQHAHARLVRSWYGPIGWACAFIDSKTTQISHGDTERKWVRSLAATLTASPSATWTWGIGQPLSEPGGRGLARASAQHAVRDLPSASNAWPT